MINKIPLISLSIAACLSGCSNEQENAPMPNIIYVLADDLGYGDLEPFNPECKISTPNLNSMASEGMIFTDAHTSSAVCSPTRYGILTGRYNWRSRLKHGVLSGKSTALIPNSRSTVASILQTQGYNTAYIGKWHLGWDWAIKDGESLDEKKLRIKDFDDIDYSKPVTNNPNDLGFNYAYGHSGSLDMPPYVYVENGMATEIPDSITGDTSKYGWWREGPTSKDFIHEDVTPNFFKRSLTYIKEKSKEEKPFFLYLALPSPHTPILPTEAWQGKSELNPYGDFVMMIDDFMGQLLTEVKDAGIENNTLIIFTSDNGCSPEADFEILAEKGHNPSYIYRGHKADIYEGGHRVPFIAKWPDKIAKGIVSNEIICTTDLMATCAEISGYSISDDEGEDSYSMLPLFEQKVLNEPLREATIHHSIKGSFAIRKGEWKLIMGPGSEGWSFPRQNDKTIDALPKIQLYNLKNDPGETNNLQATNTEKVNELKSLLTKYIAEGRSTPGIAQKNDSIDFEWKELWFID